MQPYDYTIVLTGAFGIGAGITSILKFVVPLMTARRNGNSNGKSKYVDKDICDLTHASENKLNEERHKTLLDGQTEIKTRLDKFTNQ